MVQTLDSQCGLLSLPRGLIIVHLLVTHSLCSPRVVARGCARLVGCGSLELAAEPQELEACADVHEVGRWASPKPALRTNVRRYVGRENVNRLHAVITQTSYATLGRVLLPFSLTLLPVFLTILDKALSLYTPSLQIYSSLARPSCKCHSSACNAVSTQSTAPH